jgi:hypothetical protein
MVEIAQGAEDSVQGVVVQNSSPAYCGLRSNGGLRRRSSAGTGKPLQHRTEHGINNNGIDKAERHGGVALPLKLTTSLRVLDAPRGVLGSVWRAAAAAKCA